MAKDTWIWDDDSNNKFGSCLKGDEISGKLTKISECINPDIMITELTSTLHLVAKKCGLKMKRTSSIKHHKNAPWFDRECVHLKIKMKELAKNVKQYPQINKYKEELYITKKQFKKTVIKNKRAYKDDIFNQIECSKKLSKIFWKLLDKFNPQKDELCKYGISEQRWVEHFKSISTKDN